MIKKDKSALIIVSLILISILSLFSLTAAAERGFEKPELLISPAQLEQKIESEQENLKIIDVRSGARYLLGHLPQSINMWNSDFSNPEGWVKGLIAEPEAFSATAQEKGINNNSEIVVYDGHNSIWATRLWFIFRVYGHQNVKVLEGGYEAWKEKDLPTKMLPYSPEEGNFEVREVKNEWLINSDTIAENLDNENFIILDTRSKAEYLGEETNSGAPRKGRIPNSIHLNWEKVLNEDYSFKTGAEIAEIYKKAGATKDKELITFLGHTGVRAAHSFFALRLLGYQNIKLYDEAWVGWSNRSDLPVAID